MATDPEQNATFYDDLAAHYDGHLTNPYDAVLNCIRERR